MTTCAPSPYQQFKKKKKKYRESRQQQQQPKKDKKKQTERKKLREREQTFCAYIVACVRVPARQAISHPSISFIQVGKDGGREKRKGKKKRARERSVRERNKARWRRKKKTQQPGIPGIVHMCNRNNEKSDLSKINIAMATGRGELEKKGGEASQQTRERSNMNLRLLCFTIAQQIFSSTSPRFLSPVSFFHLPTLLVICAASQHCPPYACEKAGKSIVYTFSCPELRGF